MSKEPSMVVIIQYLPFDTTADWEIQDEDADFPQDVKTAVMNSKTHAGVINTMERNGWPLQKLIPNERGRIVNMVFRKIN